MTQARILHIDTEKGWRGGQQQAAYLFTGLLAQGFHTTLVCQPNSKFSQYCHANKLPHYNISMHSEADIVAVLKIVQICKREKFNILHLHSSHAMGIGALVKVFLPSVILIGVKRVDFRIKQNIFSKLKYKYLDKVVCISEAIQRIVIDCGIPPAKTSFIHSGVKLDKFAGVTPGNYLIKKYQLPTKQIIIGTVAALVGHKDYPNLIAAAQAVLTTHDNVTFIAVGDGHLAPQIRTLLAEHQLTDKFILAGYQTNVGDYLKNFDIFVLASKMEGLGTSLLDAQAAGIPVVGTDTGGIPEIIKNHQNGLLVPHENPPALAAALNQLISDEKLCRELAKNARKSVQKFSIDKTVARNIELYNTLIT